MKAISKSILINLLRNNSQSNDTLLHKIKAKDSDINKEETKSNNKKSIAAESSKSIKQKTDVADDKSNLAKSNKDNEEQNQNEKKSNVSKIKLFSK